VTERRTRCESSRRRSLSFASRCVVHEDKISWPTHGPNVGWTIGSTMRCRPDSRAEKPLQMWPFRGVRSRASWRPTRPVTPEVAVSSPVAPVRSSASLAALRRVHDDARNGADRNADSRGRACRPRNRLAHCSFRVAAERLDAQITTCQLAELSRRPLSKAPLDRSRRRLLNWSAPACFTFCGREEVAPLDEPTTVVLCAARPSDVESQPRRRPFGFTRGSRLQAGRGTAFCCLTAPPAPGTPVAS
jgi:hypothetical protein